MFQSKVSEIQHIREKNVRIKKIINDLKLTDEKVYEPGNANYHCLLIAQVIN